MIINIVTGGSGGGTSGYGEAINAAGGYTATITLSDENFTDVDEKEY